MIIIGLTGGIASGKSSVSDYFAALGVPIIDADIIAHQLVEKNKAALKEIVHVFGDKIIDTHGNLDRAKVRQLVFADNHLKAQLESILHPLIYQEIKNQIHQLAKRQTPPPYCIVDIPLLAEKKELFGSLVDQILVVDIPEGLQLTRMLQRGNISKSEALAIMKNQASREARLAIANHIISNTEDLESLRNKVNSLDKIWNHV